METIPVDSFVMAYAGLVEVQEHATENGSYIIDIGKRGDMDFHDNHYPDGDPCVSPRCAWSYNCTVQGEVQHGPHQPENSTCQKAELA